MLKQIIKTPLFGDEVESINNNKFKVIKYSDIFKYKDIDYLLGPNWGIIILYELKPNIGHYVSIFYNNEDNAIEYFDSLGKLPDQVFKYMPYNLKVYKHGYPYLIYMILNSGYKYNYNELPLQKNSKNVNTCGWWVGIRLALKDLSLKKFQKIFKNNGDKKVSLLTN